MPLSDKEIEHVKLDLLSKSRCVGPKVVKALLERLAAVERYAWWVAPTDETGERLRAEWKAACK